MSVEIVRLLDEAAAIVASARVEHALIGGCARNAYAEPRRTKDVDFAIRADGARPARPHARGPRARAGR